MKIARQCLLGRLVPVIMAATQMPPLSATSACPGGSNHFCIYSPVDPAGSKGSQSLALGFGVASPMARGTSNDAREESVVPASGDVLRAYLTKGLPVPLDVGVMMGTSQGGEFQQIGTHLQWTMFEGFRLPALTLRAAALDSTWTASSEGVEGGMEYRLLETRRIRSMSLGFIASWGILGVLTPYAGVGKVRVGSESGDENFAGVEIQAFPPFVRLGLESRSAFARRSLMAKVSVGL